MKQQEQSIRVAADPRVYLQDTFVLFSWLWAAAMLVHMITRHKSWLHLGWEHWIGYTLTTAAVLVLLRPSSIPLLCFMLVMDAVNAFDRMPRMPNHVLINAIISFTMLLTLLQMRLGSRGPIEGGAWLSRFAPLVRIQFLLLYYYAGLAKLNTDYLNLDVSCGAAMYYEMVEHIHLWTGLMLPTARWMVAMSVWGTLILELALPVMLLIPRWRIAAVVTGYIFHLALALHPISAVYSFSSMMFAIYLLFLPGDFATQLKERWMRFATVVRWRLHEPGVIRRRIIRYGGAAGIAAGAALIGHALLYRPGPVRERLMDQARMIQNQIDDAMLVIFMIGATLTLFVLLAALGRLPLRQKPAPVRAMFRPPLTLGLVGVVMIFMMGASPYLGLRTQLAIAMFSNLRTEAGRTNHLFMPRMHLTNLQDDIVELLSFVWEGDEEDDDMDLAMIVDDNMLMTWFDFRRRTSALRQPFQVQFLRNGEEHFVDAALEPDHILCQPHPYLAAKFLDFRLIDKDGPMRCRH